MEIVQIQMVLILENNNNDFPFIKFSFNINGKLGKLYAPNNYDRYIYEFIVLNQIKILMEEYFKENFN